MNILQPKIILGVAAVITIGILISLAQEMHQRLEVQGQVRALEQQVADSEKNIIELQNLNQYFQTDAYQDRLAREKLNYRAPGEKVVLMPADKNTTAGTTTPEQTNRQYSIPELWWRAFFVDDTPATNKG